MTAQETPLVFQLLAGYFMSNEANLGTEGIFRVTGSDIKVRELEVHMSQGNYSFLTKVKSPHTVTNYWKRLLREMKEPLIPFDLYEHFESIGTPTNDETTAEDIENLDKIMLLNIKFLLNKLPEINFNTLKFHIEFFRKVVKREVNNRMTSYNVAVTVGPNIFRPKFNRS